MDRLIRLLAAMWDWVSWFFRAVIDGAISFAQTVWAKWLIVVAWVSLVVTYGTDMLTLLAELFGEWMFEEFNLAIPEIVKDGLALCNYVFPVVEVLVMTIAYCEVLIIMIIYRHLKSLIPSPVPGGGGT